MRAIGQTFRPEFQNRLDKVIVFRPLTRDLMRGILTKELNRVLERRGLKDREWAVEWEASAQDFLLEKGFSPRDGRTAAQARHRAVRDRAPGGHHRGEAVSRGRPVRLHPQRRPRDPGRVRRPRRRCQVRRAEARRGSRRVCSGMILAPDGAAAELAGAGRRARQHRAVPGVGGMGDLKARPVAGDVWLPTSGRRPDRHATLARLALMDRVKAAMEHGGARCARAAAQRHASARGKSSRELVGRLALQLHLLKEGIRDVYRDRARSRWRCRSSRRSERPASARRRGPGAGSCSTCIAAGPNNRHMQLAELAGAAPSACRCLLISGFGAHRLLAAGGGAARAGGR